MFIGLSGLYIALVNIISPYGIECRDIACHARHERSHKRRKAQAKHAGGQIVAEHKRYRIIIIDHAIGPFKGKTAYAALIGKSDGDHAGKNHQDRHEHFRNSADKRGAARRRH